MKIDPKAVSKVPTPKPSRAQILEALVTLKIEQVQAERTVYDKETERLRLYATSLFQGCLTAHLLGQFQTPVPLPSCESYGSDKGKINEAFTLRFETRLLPKDVVKAIEAHNAHANSDSKPKINIGKSWATEEDVRRFVRNQIRQQLEVQEGTNRDRLTTMLADKAFKQAMENTLAKIEGKPVIETTATEA